MKYIIVLAVVLVTSVTFADSFSWAMERNRSGANVCWGD